MKYHIMIYVKEVGDDYPYDGHSGHQVTYDKVVNTYDEISPFLEKLEQTINDRNS